MGGVALRWDDLCGLSSSGYVGLGRSGTVDLWALASRYVGLDLVQTLSIRPDIIPQVLNAFNTIP